MVDAWREREMRVVRMSNEEFRKLGVDAQKVMVAAIREDDQRAYGNRIQRNVD